MSKSFLFEWIYLISDYDGQVMLTLETDCGVITGDEG